MDVSQRNYVQVKSHHGIPMLFAHGYGCDQEMWRHVWPAFANDHQVILFDHVGAGHSDLNAFSEDKYASLDGYADDIIEIIEAMNLTEVIFVGHSVSALIGILASIKRPELFKQLILVGPSPSYINDGDYTGGFEREQINELLESLDRNHLGWSMAMAPVIMANPDRKELGEELANSFCKTDPAIAKHFARTTFLTDKREVLSHTTVPSLILQCSDDVIAPRAVGEYMHEHLPNSELVILKATGHCPNLSAPEETIDAIQKYLDKHIG